MPASDTASPSEEMRTLTSLIRDLEDQLDRMVATRDAAAKDLEDERHRRAALEKTVEDLKERIRHNEEEVSTRESLDVDVTELRHKRSRLSVEVRDLTRRLEVAKREAWERAGLIVRLRLAQSEALTEVQNVESQFARAIQMASDVRTQLEAIAEERDSLTQRLGASEKILEQLESERDSLLSEVEQSRAALDEIRRSLVDACAVSTGALRARATKAPAKADTGGGQGA